MTPGRALSLNLVVKVLFLALLLAVFPAPARSSGTEALRASFHEASAEVLELIKSLKERPLALSSEAPAAPALAAADLPNFAHSGGGYYRGGQPSREGLRMLKKLGISTILNLRGDPKPFEKDLAESLGMRYIHIPMSKVKPPPDSKIDRFTAVLEDSASSPVFVHCKRGSDRTGLMSAIRRMKYQGWKPRPAAKEMIAFKAVSPLLIRYVFIYYKRLRGK